MSNVVPDSVEAQGTPLRLPHPSLGTPPPDTDDAARLIGEVFRRLAQAAEVFPPQAHARIVAAVLIALGKAVLIEAECQADRLRERISPPTSGVRVSATARRIDFDGWDPGDPTES